MNIVIEDVITNVTIQVLEPVSEDIIISVDNVVEEVVVSIVEVPYIMEKDFIKNGKMIVFKLPTNLNENEQEIGDLCMGFVEGQFITANYLGGNQLLLTSYDI